MPPRSKRRASDVTDDVQTPAKRGGRSRSKAPDSVLRCPPSSVTLSTSPCGQIVYTFASSQRQGQLESAYISDYSADGLGLASALLPASVLDAVVKACLVLFHWCVLGSALCACCRCSQPTQSLTFHFRGKCGTKFLQPQLVLF